MPDNQTVSHSQSTLLRRGSTEQKNEGEEASMVPARQPRPSLLEITHPSFAAPLQSNCYSSSHQPTVLWKYFPILIWTLRIAFVTCLSFQQRNTRQERAQKQVSLQCITFYWEIASRAYILLCWHKDCDTDRGKTYKWWDDQGLVQLQLRLYTRHWPMEDGPWTFPENETNRMLFWPIWNCYIHRTEKWEQELKLNSNFGFVVCMATYQTFNGFFDGVCYLSLSKTFAKSVG